MRCSSFFQASSDELVSEYLTGMPLLESLSVWQGETLKHTGAKIRKHCPEFKRLTVYRWYAVSHTPSMNEILMISLLGTIWSPKMPTRTIQTKIS